MIQFLPHDLTQTYPDAYIEEEGRPKSSITASLYGENNDHTGQWAKRPTNGQMPPVSIQWKHIKTNKLDFWVQHSRLPYTKQYNSQATAPGLPPHMSIIGAQNIPHPHMMTMPEMEPMGPPNPPPPPYQQ